jgi:type I restriction enzyme, S subunit
VTLPTGWSGVPLGEVTSPTRPREKPSTHPDLPFIGMEHVEAHTMRLLGTVPAETLRSAAVHFMPGDVLYGRLRPYLNKVYRPEFEGYCSAEFIVLPESSRVDGSFLQYFLNSARFVSFASHVNTGDRPRVDWKQLASFEMPLPPVDEQQRIVAMIEEQFSRLDVAGRSLRVAAAHLRKYRLSLLASAVTGALIHESWDQWPELTVAELAVDVRYGTSVRAGEDDGGVPILRMGNVVDGELRIDRLKYLPSDHNEFPQLLLQAGDVLFNRTNSPELVGKAAIYRGSPSPCSFASYLIRVRLDDGCAPEMLTYFLNSPYGRDWARSVVSQQVGQANINGGKLKALAIRVPPAKDQARLVESVESQLTLMRSLRGSLQAAERRAEGLRQAVLRDAFSGYLAAPNSPSVSAEAIA